MGLISAIRGWWSGLFSKQNITEAFGVQELAITNTMLEKQKLYRLIVRGAAPWNDINTPSLMIAGTESAEVAQKVVVGLESEIEGSARANYLNEQYKAVKESLKTAVIAACNNGEIIFKPFMTNDGLEAVVSETDCYWPLAFNVRNELIDVVFGASLQRDKWIYKLLERHRYNEAANEHEIIYKAYKVEQSTQAAAAGSLGREVPLTEIPEWAHLQNVIIHDIEKPLFAHFKMPSDDVIESPQRQGLPLWSKAVEMLRKADQHEARTDWEFEGGELAIDASVDLFKPSGNKKGNTSKPQLPKGKERLFRTVEVGAEDFQMKEFAPEFRIDGLDKRMNQILRRIEFLSGISYGVISDISEQAKTATEVRASKDRFFTTVCDIQQALQKTLEHLIYSFSKLADIQGVPYGNYEMSFTWDDSIGADREREFDEKLKLLAVGVLSPEKVLAWYEGIDIEQAQKEIAELRQTVSEF